MASTVDICNMALSQIRAGSINSLEETSLQAQQCKLHYPFLRQALLRESCWGFARRIDELAQLSTRQFNWAYSYQYPSDCLKIEKLILNFETINDPVTGALRHRRIEDLQSPDLERQVKYEVFNDDGNKIIAANEQQLRIKYTVDVDDPNLFDFTFIQTLSYYLAATLAIPLVGGDTGRGLRQDALALYTSNLNAAIANDENEQYNEPVDSDFITVRN